MRQADSSGVPPQETLVPFSATGVVRIDGSPLMSIGNEHPRELLV